VRRLASRRHAPGDWILHARMIARSGDGRRTGAIAAELGGHPPTVRERLHAFNDRGLDGLGRRPVPGRPPRLTEAERRALIALVASPPPGRLVTQADGTLAPAGAAGGEASEWSLDARAAAAQSQGIQGGRRQIRRIWRREGVRGRRPPSWGTSTAQDFAPQGRRSSPAPPTRRRRRRRSAWTNWAR
jgi:transposase